MRQDERNALRAKRIRERLEADKRQLAQVEAQQREDARKTRDRRRYAVGTLAEAAGLCSLDDTTLAGLFAELTQLTATPNPVAVLQSMLSDWPVLQTLTPAAAGSFLLTSPDGSDSSEGSRVGTGNVLS
jgi:hypothetical protein